MRTWQTGGVAYRKEWSWMANDLDTKIPLSRAGSRTSLTHASTEPGIGRGVLAADGSSNVVGGLV